MLVNGKEFSIVPYANLHGADLHGAKNIPELIAAQLSILADGALIVYKKCIEGIVTLRIPVDASRSNATGRKCRASKAVVISTPGGKAAHSRHAESFTYIPGATVATRQPFDTDRWNECGSGIHFFLSKIEAEKY